jgi:putative tricarboxylic transport membrane protein
VFRTILRGSVIGSLIGIIPGVGAAPAAFINYSRSKKLSKHPEEYGKGSLEGVAAAESGNNGVCGPTLIPLLTLGIPGDKTTAVLLGAFVIQGLTPGPLLFQKHIDVIYGIFIAMIVINTLVLGIGKIVVKWAALISRVPKEIMFSVVFIALGKRKKQASS